MQLREPFWIQHLSQEHFDIKHAATCTVTMTADETSNMKSEFS